MSRPPAPEGGDGEIDRTGDLSDRGGDGHGHAAILVVHRGEQLGDAHGVERPGARVLLFRGDGGHEAVMRPPRRWRSRAVSWA
jgi:hypothetical protein